MSTLDLDRAEKRTIRHAMERPLLALILLCSSSCLGLALALGGCSEDESPGTGEGSDAGGYPPKDATVVEEADAPNLAPGADSAIPKPDAAKGLDGGADGAGDGGADGRADGAGDGGADGGGSTPGQVSCGASTCTSTQFCCDFGDGGCQENEGGTCFGAAGRCDEAADCPMGQVCCSTLGAACQAGPCLGAQLCKTTGECGGADGGCRVQSCLGRMIQACGTPFGC